MRKFSDQFQLFSVSCKSSDFQVQYGAQFTAHGNHCSVVCWGSLLYLNVVLGKSYHCNNLHILVDHESMCRTTLKNVPF